MIGSNALALAQMARASGNPASFFRQASGNGASLEDLMQAYVALQKLQPQAQDAPTTTVKDDLANSLVGLADKLKGAPQPQMPQMPQMQAQPQMPQGQPPMPQNPMAGVAGLNPGVANPTSMAGGGIVAFEEGGEVPGYAGGDLIQSKAAYDEALAAYQAQQAAIDPNAPTTWFERNFSSFVPSDELIKLQQAESAYGQKMLQAEDRPGATTPQQRAAFDERDKIALGIMSGKFRTPAAPVSPAAAPPAAAAPPVAPAGTKTGATAAPAAPATDTKPGLGGAATGSRKVPDVTGGSKGLGDLEEQINALYNEPRKQTDRSDFKDYLAEKTAERTTINKNLLSESVLRAALESLANPGAATGSKVSQLVQGLSKTGLGAMNEYATGKKDLKDLDKEIMQLKVGMNKDEVAEDTKGFERKASRLDALLKIRSAEIDADLKRKQIDATMARYDAAAKAAGAKAGRPNSASVAAAKANLASYEAQLANLPKDASVETRQSLQGEINAHRQYLKLASRTGVDDAQGGESGAGGLAAFDFQ